jgi:transcriptional regulator with XRE-family HTH domain
MPIGILTDAELEEELRNGSGKRKESHKPVVQAEIVEKVPLGRGIDTPNVPDSLRQLIGEEALLNGRQSALQFARDFGVSPSSVSAYAKGATSTTTYNTPSKSIIGHINKARERAVRRASKTLNQALGAITQEKLDYADASDLSGIAKDMSVIIKNLEPQKEVADSSADKQPQFVIYAPQFKKEENFEVINIQE